MSSKNSLILIMGSIRRGEYEYLLSKGYKLGVIVDTNRQVSLANPKHFDLVEYFDFSKKYSDLENLVNQIQKTWNINSILNLREYYVKETAKLQRYLGLPSMNDDSVELVTNKTLMHKRFVEKLGVNSTAKFSDVSTENDLINFMKFAKYPVILKPNNFYGSLFVRKINNPKDLISTFRENLLKISEFSNKYGIKMNDASMQVEEYLEGSNHSLDALVDNNGDIHAAPIVDVTTGNDLGYPDFHHFARWSPSLLSDDLQEETNRFGKEAIKALNIKNSAVHVEFINTTHGIKLLEIAARPGGHRNRVLEMTYNIPYIHEYIMMQQGKTPNLNKKTNKGFMIVTPFPKEKKRFNHVSNTALNDILNFPTYHFHEIKTQVGSWIGPAYEGFLSSFVIELQSDCNKAIQRDTQKIIDMGDIFE